MPTSNDSSRMTASDSLREQLISLRLDAARKSRQAARKISPRESSDALIPLSFAQERLWILDQMGLVGTAYNVPMTLTLSGPLDETALERSFSDLVHRHEILRTHFVVRNDQPYQQIDPADDFHFRRIDLSAAASVSERDQQLREQTKCEHLHRFDLAEGPLLRVLLVTLEKQRYHLLITLHHAISDGWSAGILLREISALYLANVRGCPNRLPPLDVQYADYAVWQRQRLTDGALGPQLEYWKTRLSNAPLQLTLPTDRPRPAIETFKGGHYTFHLSSAIASSVEMTADRYGTTPFMVLLATYALLLSRYSGQDDVLVGSPVAGRNSRELEGLIGFFVNTLVLRVQVTSTQTFQEMLQLVKDVTLEAYANQEIPFDTLVKELRPERNLSRQPLFQVMLAFQNYPDERLDLGDVMWQWGEIEYVTSHFDLTMYLSKCSTGLTGTLEYAKDLFDSGSIERMAAHFETLLLDAVSNPTIPVHELSLLSATERHLLLSEWNETTVPYPKHSCIHDLFREQVARTPQAQAIVCNGHWVTYAALNSYANQLARHLRTIGVGPEQLVGVCVERKTEMIVVLLGILKAGAAFIALDPNSPSERLTQILHDCTPSALVTENSLQERFREISTHIILIDSERDRISGESDEDLEALNVGVQSHHLAYVIYTSGSTGRPKGVEIEHRNAVNMICWARSATPAHVFSDTLQSTALTFDLSIYECFVPLTMGGRIHIVDNALALISRYIPTTLINTVPSAIKALLDSQSIPDTTKVVNLAGEPLTKDVVDRIFSSTKVEFVCNLYAPSETTTYSTFVFMTRDSGFIPSIGSPLANTQIYILDPHQNLVPIGVPGEIYIGGAGVARGYLKRPELTAERFVDNPFTCEPQARMYKTGDVGRWRPDGSIEYLGRNDHQVKIRGYRIELGEIEACLLGHLNVRDAVVLARASASGDQRLVAYVVGIRDDSPKDTTHAIPESHHEEVVGDWEAVWKETYATRGEVSTPSFTGWNSSYDGHPIPEHQMREWLEFTLQRIRSLDPHKVLEIGCGVGLLLEHLAPQCEVYIGTDFSPSAISQLHQWLKHRPEQQHVRVMQRAATELSDFETASLDTVILNSVVQYFPDADYLRSVLQEAIRLVRPGGKIFVGDVRHLQSLSMFQGAVQLRRTSRGDIGQLRSRVSRAIAHEKELLIDPYLFLALPGNFSGIAAVEVHMKRGESANELTRHRYDVILHIGDGVSTQPITEFLDWHSAISGLPEFKTVLSKRRWPAVTLRGIPNQRLTQEAAAQRIINAAEEHSDIEDLRRQIDNLIIEGVNPEELWQVANQLGFDAVLTPGELDSFDVQLFDRSRRDEVRQSVSPARPLKDWRTYTNDPIENAFRRQLISHLREYLQERLPDYMVPAAWVALGKLPLSPNGKVDRRALPAPELSEQLSQQYDPPQGDIEKGLAKLWQELLQVDRVGRQDNFFDIGGHSLLALQALSRINQRFGTDLKAVDLYQSPSIRQLADRMHGARQLKQPVLLAQEAILPAEIAPKSGAAPVPAKELLLTGATGFVGRFLLAQLLQDKGTVIHCLVRARSEGHAMTRLKATLSQWDLWQDGFESRIRAVAGDLSLPRLGLNDTNYHTLAQSIDSIYHCGTSMNHLETYDMSKAANVDGVKELLRLATHNAPKLVNYISTLGVFRTGLPGTTRSISEHTPIDYERHLNSEGYSASKWVGEKLCMIAAARGIPCNILRLGFVWADTRFGRYEQSQWGYRIIRTCLLSGYGIRNFHFSMAPTPVDYVARAIVALSDRHLQGNGIFHISSPNEVTAGIFERCNQILHSPLKLLPIEEWITEIKRMHGEGKSVPDAPFLDFAFSQGTSSTPESSQEPSSSHLTIDCIQTRHELEAVGIVAPILDDGLLRESLNGILSQNLDLSQSVKLRKAPLE